MHRKLTKLLTRTAKFNKACKRRVKSRTRAGLTLTEVVIASAILIVAMVPILKALTSTYLNTAIIERKTRSLILAQARLDEIKARSVYDYSRSFAESNLSLDGSFLCNVADTSEGSYLRKITVSIGSDLNDNDVLDIDEIEVVLTTYVAKRWDS